MRASSLRAAAVLAAVAGLLAAPGAVAQEKDKDKGYETKLPINPFKDAKEGDWFVMVARMKASEGSGVPEEMLKPKFFEWKITKVDGDKVTLKETEHPEGTTKERSYGKKEAPTIKQYLEMSGSGSIGDVKIVDAKIKVGGKEFACKKLSFVEKDGAMTVSGRIFFAEGVKGGGPVRMEAEIKGDTGTLTMTGEVAGYGNGDKAEWGDTLADAQKANKK